MVSLFGFDLGNTAPVSPNSIGAQVVNGAISSLPFGNFLPKIGGGSTGGIKGFSGYQQNLTGNTNSLVSSVSSSQTGVQATDHDQRVRLRLRDASLLGGSSSSTPGVNNTGAILDGGVSSITGTASGAGTSSGSGSAASGVLKPIIDTNGMIFPYTPAITYNAGAQYAALNLTHANQDFHYYTHTPAVQIQVAGKFSSRSIDEATYTYSAFQFLRSITKMRFGYNDPQAGHPPPVLVFSGWGTMMFSEVPCILTQFSFDFPDNVDYVYYQAIDAWLPVLTTINITLIVQHTPGQLVEFDWDKFASGDLVKSGGFT